MAIIAISRQVAALGDEVAQELAKKLGYTFIGRKEIEKRIIDLGFAEEKLEKYDEKKPGFFASLAKDRDEYLDYLQTAVLDAASTGNCILIGRGAFVILEDVPNLLSVRFVAKESIRVDRLMHEFDWDEKQALKRIEESDANRVGFHKSFFNLSTEDSSAFHMVLNTGVFDKETAASMLSQMTKSLITPQMEKDGSKKIAELLEAQKLVNILVFEHKLNINFLRAVIDGDTITLQGIADSGVLVEKATTITKEIMSDKKVVSAISIVQDFKAYP